MHYISTRDNHTPLPSSRAIELGMVPEGGLFVPDQVPVPGRTHGGAGSYQEAARRILAPLLPDFKDGDLDSCIAGAYNSATFDCPEVAPIKQLDDRCSVMELWHGPTAAFKDVALQIMPHFMGVAKANTGNSSHTVILVATSGDTGKAALEGFKNCKGISIVVFYPYRGVSEIQKLQMTTTDGDNTHVIGVEGNFDDCQNSVKQLLGDLAMRKRFAERGIEFSSANSINWGRLCPQIVYYWTSYDTLVKRSIIAAGEPVDFCIPTGNFGNILAGYYAMRMGLPVGKLICASNRNKVLADFFATGTYDSNRTFYRTMSPSMDILISSNLERFLFEMTGHNGAAVAGWSSSLAAEGTFTVDPAALGRMREIIDPGWIDESDVLAAIRDCFSRTGYVLDTHTAVGFSVHRRTPENGRHTIIASTASPYKFPSHVLEGMSGEIESNEFRAIERIAALSGMPVHRALANLRERPVKHAQVIGKELMRETLLDLLETIPL